MKKVDLYLLGSLFKTALGATVLCTLMLVSVQLFQHLDAFLRNQTSVMDLAKLALLYVPSSLCFVLAPSLLFSASFTFSQLSANNELICLYNATFSQKRLVIPFLIVGILCSVLQFFVQESIDIPCQKSITRLETELLGSSSNNGHSDVTLSDLDAGYVFHANGYDEVTRTARKVTVILLDGDNHLEGRVDARTASWNEDGTWTLEDVDLSLVDTDQLRIERSHHQTYLIERLNLEPQLLGDNSTDIQSMPIPQALAFLKRIEKLDHFLWQGYSVDFWQRLLGNLAPFIMLFIACTLNYRFKKNVLLFSIILSLCLAVVYYVLQMMSLILARQGILSPVSGMIIPMIMIVLIAILERLFL